MKICDKAKTCHSAPSCQHGRPHKEILDCSVRKCFVGGEVSCQDCETMVSNKAGDELGDGYAQ